MTKKEQLIQEHLAKPIEVGDEVILLGIGSSNPTQWSSPFIVKKLENGIIYFDQYGRGNLSSIEISKAKRPTYKIGYNPFPEKSWNSRIRFTGYDLGNMISLCGYERRKKTFNNEKFGEIEIPELNWEPIIKDKNGNEIKYQRDFCWSLEDKQLLIESIYNQLDIGKIIIRKRSWEWVENRVKQNKIEGTAFRDIVDGKQRLNAIIGFMQDEYYDLKGNFYSDFSDYARYKFDNFSAMAYGEMEEGSTDEDVQSVFLNVNFTGKPMSQEHIEFVKSIQLK